MTRRAAARAIGIARALAALGALACGPLARAPQAPAPHAAEASDDTRRAEGRPPLVVVAREGDARSAVAVAVQTEGIAPERGAEAAAAIAALIEARAPAGLVSVALAGDGARARGLAKDARDAAAITDTLRAALLAPVAEADMGAVRKKLALLARRPLADAALDLAARCAGEAVDAARGDAHVEPPGADVVESWRRAAVGIGRVAFATAGAADVGDAVAEALARGPAWPAASPVPESAPVAGEVRVYDATGDTPSVPEGGARATLVVHMADAAIAVRAAEALGDPQGALVARLGGLDAPARLRDVTATAHAHGGCLLVSLDVAPREMSTDGPARVATAVALARQEIATVLDGATHDDAGTASLARSLARRAGDPRDAADLAAWWALSATDLSLPPDARIAVAVGLAPGRGGPVPASDSPLGPRAQAIRAELDRAAVSFHEPVVDAKTRVEAGQGETWIALGSPCGTLAESASDAGLGAAFALAAAERTTAALRGTGARAEAWATSDGIGVTVHGPALPGESPEAHARRLADAVARSFAAEPVDAGAVSRARARLLDASDAPAARAWVTLAEAIAPGHPSWLAPMGPLDALGRSSDAAVTARASSLRAGPLRVAVIADASDAQAQAAVRAVDRWIARRPEGTRACPAPPTPAAPRPGTYAVETAAGGPSQAWLAAPFAPGDATARAAAETIAAALDGPDGLLARALSGGLARSWSARAAGGTRAAALVVRVDSAGGALDAAVAQVRALLDRVRQSSLADADRARAGASLAERDLADSLDPAHRVAALWRGSPGGDRAAPGAPGGVDAVAAFAASTLKDDALVIVAVRPAAPRAKTDPPTPPKGAKAAPSDSAVRPAPR